MQPEQEPDLTELSDRELLRRVFPEEVISRVEEELGLVPSPDEIPEPESESDFPDTDSI